MPAAGDGRETGPLAMTGAAWWRTAFLGIQAGTLILAPLAYGAVHPWAYTVIGLTLAGLSLVWLGRLAGAAARPGGDDLRLPRPPLWGVVLGALALAVLQVIPLPREWVGWLSPQAVSIRALGNGYGLAAAIPLSLNPEATVQEVLKIWPAVVLFFLLIFTVTSRREIAALVYVLLAVAVFEAVYGLWHLRSHLIWGWRNPFYQGRLCGTFINSNHVAALLGLAILLGFGLVLAQGAAIAPRPPPPGRRVDFRSWSRAENLEPLVRRSWCFLVLLVLLVAFFFAASRGAMLALGVGLALMALLGGSRHSHRWPLYLLVFLVAGAALYSLWLGGAWVWGRFLDLSDRGRQAGFWGALALFRAFPLTGAGLGSFEDLVYGVLSPDLSRTRLLYAHNDWVQLLAEFGVVGFSLVAGGWLLFFVGLIRAWQRRRDPWARGLGLGALAALAAGAFHALGEFLFHIPAFTLTYAALAALTYLILHNHETGAPFSYRTWRLAGPRLAPFLCLALALMQGLYAWQAWQAWQAHRAVPQETDLPRLNLPLEAADFARALAWNPRQAGYYAGLGRVLAREGVPNLDQAQEIEGLLRQAIFRAPARWDHRLQLGDFLLGHYRLAPERYLPEGLRELAAAVALFPAKAELHLRLGLALAWAEHNHFAAVPPTLVGQSWTHLERAVTLMPELHKRLPRPPPRPPH